jgi:NitT/TauT family transport system permease protein
MRTANQFWRSVWGGAAGVLLRARRFTWVDVVVAIGVAGLLYGLLDLAGQWTAPHRASVEIDLSPWALPEYTFFSLCRGLIAYCISLGFTLVYGYWAAKDHDAAQFLVPFLDILQSIPVLAFLPGLVLALGAAFPRSNVGLELAAIIMIFTGQAWNMTFSFYHSLRSVPRDQQEAATIYRFTWWQRLKWVELPFSTIGLVWNSMMSMAGGWFFLMINEAYQLGDKPFSLPGVGSYMKLAVDKGRVDAMLWAMLAMLVMIVGLDQLLWRPVVVWAQKFRVEEGGEQAVMSSWFLNWLRRSHLMAVADRWVTRIRRLEASTVWRRRDSAPQTVSTAAWAPWISRIAFCALLALLGYGALRLVQLLVNVSFQEWGYTLGAAATTLGRVLLSTAVATVWTVPVGLAIGLSPRLSRVFQPVIQVAASFPAPMLFPLVIAGMQFSGVSVGWGAILLMLLGTQWYILFNVIAGAMAIPADLREAGRSYRLNTWQRFRVLLLPAIFPYLVTGWVTAAGGAWNASIVAEYVTFQGDVLQATWGLGGQINQATADANFPLLAASVLVMAVSVVLFNRVVWRQLYQVAEQRFSLSK